AMTRLIALCSNTQLLPEEERTLEGVKKDSCPCSLFLSGEEEAKEGAHDREQSSKSDFLVLGRTQDNTLCARNRLVPRNWVSEENEEGRSQCSLTCQDDSVCDFEEKKHEYFSRTDESVNGSNVIGYDVLCTERYDFLKSSVEKCIDWHSTNVMNDVDDELNDIEIADLFYEVSLSDTNNPPGKDYIDGLVERKSNDNGRKETENVGYCGNNTSDNVESGVLNEQEIFPIGICESVGLNVTENVEVENRKSGELRSDESESYNGESKIEKDSDEKSQERESEVGNDIGEYVKAGKYIVVKSLIEIPRENEGKKEEEIKRSGKNGDGTGEENMMVAVKCSKRGREREPATAEASGILPSVDLRESGSIETLIKDFFGEDWEEEDVLKYMSEEEKKENETHVTFKDEVTYDNDDGNSNLVAGEKSLEEEEEVRTTKSKNNGKIMENNVCMLSLELDDLEYIDQGDQEEIFTDIFSSISENETSENMGKKRLDKINEVSENMDEKRLDKIQEKLNKLREEMTSLLDLYPEERSFLEGSVGQKKMPKILQKIHKEEEKHIAWKRAKRFVENIMDGDDNVNTKDTSNKVRDKRTNTIQEEYLCGKNVNKNDDVSVINTKRKRTTITPFSLDNECQRKRITSHEVDNRITDINIKDEDRDDEFFMTDDESVFGDDEDSEIDCSKPTKKAGKRVKAESISSTVANILDSLLELREDETHNDGDFLSVKGEDAMPMRENCQNNVNEQNMKNSCEGKEKHQRDEDRHEKYISINNGKTQSDTLPCKSNYNKLTTVKKAASSFLTQGTTITVDINPNLEWNENCPPPVIFSESLLPGSAPGTPEHSCKEKLNVPKGEITNVSYTREIVTPDQEVVTVKLRRPRCPANDSSPGSHVDTDEVNSNGSCEVKDDPNDSLGEDKNMKEIKDKKRLLRSLSFFSRNSQSNLSLISGVSHSPTETSSLSSSFCNSSVFATLTTPRRWSNALGKKRRAVQSCIFAEAPLTPTNGRLPSRVRSEPNVTERRITGNENERLPRRLSKVWGEKRKAVKSCIFPDPEDEDSTPYTALQKDKDIWHTEKVNNTRAMIKSVDFQEKQTPPTCTITQDQVITYKKHESKRVPSSPVKLYEKSVSYMDLMSPKLQSLSSEVSLPDTHLGKPYDSQVCHKPVYAHRPQSLIVIPESRTGYGSLEREELSPFSKRPQSLMLPADMRIPKRKPSLIPPEAKARPRSLSRLSYRDLRILRSSMRRSPSIDENSTDPLLSSSPTHFRHGYGRSVSLSESETESRKHNRSWSVSPAPGSSPLKGVHSPEKWPDVDSSGEIYPVIMPRRNSCSLTSPDHPYTASNT
ncbi:hypothetical protein SK128_010694, partial [Halocaridina rubra]